MPSARKPNVEGRQLARALWRLVRPYWTSPEAKRSVLLLGLAIALQFGAVYANVLVSDSQRDVGNALGARDVDAFGRGIGLMVLFMLLSVVVPSYSEWVQQVIRVRWRRWFTQYYIERWIGPHAYCQGELHRGELDNPDVRIAEDVRDFVASALGLSLSLLASVVTLLSFGAMLWNLSSAWAIPVGGKTTQIPGLMLWIAVVFALFSMWITNRVGRKLIPLNFDRIRVEADFRYGLVRYRDKVEAVALTRGEAVERLGAIDRFQRVVENFYDLVGAQRNLSILTQGMGQASSLVPLIVAGLAYFADLVTLGVIAQTRYAYGQVAGGLAWFVNAYQEIARWRANIERLASFSDAMDATQREFERGGIAIGRAEPERIALADLQVEAPRGVVLLDGLNATLAAAQRAVITGAQGTGRTMLIRALAGIWPFGSGRIEEPARERMLFLSKRPYLPIGTLRGAVSYPSASGAFTDAEIEAALRLVDLEALATRLDEDEPWEEKLSAHEQQRLAIVRVLLQKPAWIVLDEATSDLDDAMEAKIYTVVEQQLPHAGMLAVAERPGALRLMSQRWALTATDQGRVTLAVT
jgi:vitamin B12/bleomycin/antimicrobial peptide transport system ATP-binding/permease protein